MRGNWKAERVRRGWTLAEEAKRLNVSVNAASCWERGVSMPSAKNLLDASDLFGVSPRYLLEETGESDA